MLAPFRDAQSAVSFVATQTFNIETGIYEVRYPSYDYAALVPVVTEGNEWARGTIFYASDSAGVADWLNGAGFDMPYADVTREQFSRGFHLAGIGYEWNLEEINVARMEGRNMGDEKARSARRIAESFLWEVCMTGRNPRAAASEKGWTGLVNDATVAAGDVPADGSGGSTFWASKTPDQILRDINTGISGVYTGTNETDMADTVLLPSAELTRINSTSRAAGSDQTIGRFLAENNDFTQRTGRPLMIRGLRTLATADPGGDGRAVIYRRDPEVVRFHLPMPHRFLTAWQKGSMTWEVPGIMRAGGTEWRLPGSGRYLDGISAAPT